MAPPKRATWTMSIHSKDGITQIRGQNSVADALRKALASQPKAPAVPASLEPKKEIPA